MKAFVKYKDTILDIVDFERNDKHFLLKSISDSIDALCDTFYDVDQLDMEVVFQIHISRSPEEGQIAFDFTPKQIN